MIKERSTYPPPPTKSEEGEIDFDNGRQVIKGLSSGVRDTGRTTYPPSPFIYEEDCILSIRSERFSEV